MWSWSLLYPPVCGWWHCTLTVAVPWRPYHVDDRSAHLEYLKVECTKKRKMVRKIIHLCRAFTVKTSTSQLTLNLYSFMRCNRCAATFFVDRTDLQASCLICRLSNTTLYNAFCSFHSLLIRWRKLFFSTSRLNAWVDVSLSTLLRWDNINSAMALSCDFFSAVCVLRWEATFISRSLFFCCRHRQITEVTMDQPLGLIFI